jgi:arylformamidase
MTRRYLVLSHLLHGEAPVWSGNPPAAEIEHTESIDRGDIANTTRLHLFSHSGTHVDTPRHFNPDGPAAWQLPIDAYVFQAPRVIELPKPDGGFITLDDLSPHDRNIAAADLVLLRTGWGTLREGEPSRYVEHGPLLHPAAARWLIDEHPMLRAIATDGVSIGSPSRPEPTIETHHVLTGVGRTDGRFVLIYEDVRIPPEVADAIRVFAWPLFVVGADGSPCTIVAELPS